MPMKTNNTSHYKKVCTCGKQYEQCRCPARVKSIVKVPNGCPDCRNPEDADEKCGRI